MTEFKINSALTEEISSLRESGNNIGENYTALSSDNVSTLKTAISIIAQHETIKSLLDLYKAMVLRDAQDLDSLVEDATKMDASLSSSYNVRAGGEF